MAESKGSGKGDGANPERIMNVPLRKEWLKVPRNKRGKRAVSTLRDFVSMHMKTHEVKVSQRVNEKIWIRGVQKPPQSIRVKVNVDDKGVASVRLPGEIEIKSRKEEKKGRLEQMRKNLEKDGGLPIGGAAKGEVFKKGKKKESPPEENAPSKKDPAGEKEPVKKPVPEKEKPMPAKKKTKKPAVKKA